MGKMVPITQIPIQLLTDQELTKWSIFVAGDVRPAGTGWMARDEVIRMALEIIRLRKQLHLADTGQP